MLDPVTIERLRALAGEGPILIALSGGGDSVALLHALAGARGGASLHAAIVDHALREGSARDAERALGFARALGVAGEILTLAWPADANRAQQATRDARYAALCTHARAIGARVIAVAHTADDQAETVFMRAGAGSSWRGLAGMAAISSAPLWPEGRGVLLARPLLDARRDALRAELRARGAEWIDDPANANVAFERVRVRQRLAALEAAGFDPMRLVRLASRLRARVDELDCAAFALIQRAVLFADGRVVVRFDAWRGADEVRWRALAVLMAAAAGASREPRAGLMPAIERRVMAPEHKGSTHSGVFFAPEPGGVALEREYGAFMGRGAQRPREPIYVALKPGVETIWDGRFAVTADGPGWRLHRNGARPKIDRRTPSGGENPAPIVRSLAFERVAHAFGGVKPAQD